jgi:hypothetical protein
MLNALAHQIGQDTSIQGEISDFLHHFTTMWCDFSQLIILSFHDLVRDNLTDTTTLTNAAILLPVQSGAVLQCHSQDVRFVYVRANVNYNDKIAYGVHTFCTKYFIELPQDIHNMTNGAGVAYTLTSYGGPDDLCTYNTFSTETLITNRTLQQ